MLICQGPKRLRNQKISLFERSNWLLKSILHPSNSQCAASSNASSRTKKTFLFPDKLCASSPAVRHALDIGREAELFAGEKNYERALTSFKSALGSLMPLFQQEPKGNRRDLLYHQIERWMRDAEQLKELIEGVQEAGKTETLDGDSHERCSIQ